MILYLLCFINIAFAGELNKDGEDYSNVHNTTTLYPVNNSFYLKGSKQQRNISKVEKDSNEQTNVANEQTNLATNKQNRYTHSDIDQFKETDKTNNADKPSIALNSNESKNSDITIDKVTSNEDKLKSVTLKKGTRWKIDTTYAPSKTVDESQSRDFETKDMKKDFKPSPHLGSFYDEDSFVPTPVTEGSFTPYKPQSFGSFERDFYKMMYKRPVDSYQTPIDTPYQFENAPRTGDWHSDTGLAPRTTEEPSKIPAGGLYKLPDAFQEKPNSDGDNDDFGLEFKDQKESSMKKRGNPWKSFLHMVTALLPVGLIVSALTPSVITFENTDNNNPYYPSQLSRRSDEVPSPPRISERCKRRLLCEIHADQNYVRNLRFSQRKPCYKLHCEDPHAMTAMLRWLLNQHHSHHRTPGYRPADHDRRGYIMGN